MTAVPEAFNEYFQPGENQTETSGADCAKVIRKSKMITGKLEEAAGRIPAGVVAEVNLNLNRIDDLLKLDSAGGKFKVRFTYCTCIL
ncbi:MAG: hypothetical protein GY696_32620 [Gammaproteobacteria bacterium]|nr:hypothetical protein [Gammaproteobacteria bacterium]